MADFKYLNNPKFDKPHTIAMGNVLDQKLHALKERKGEFWAALIEYAVMTRMMVNCSLVSDSGKDVVTSANGKFLSAVLQDKYRDAADGKLREMMVDSDVVLDAVLKSIGK